MILFLQRRALTFSIFIFFPPKVAFFLVHSHCHLLCCMCAHHEIDWLHDGWWQTYFSMSAVNCRNLSTAESSTVLEDARIIQFPDRRTSTLTLLYESTLSLSYLHYHYLRCCLLIERSIVLFYRCNRAFFKQKTALRCNETPGLLDKRYCPRNDTILYRPNMRGVF